MSQTNVKQGPFVIPAGEDLTGKEARLVYMTHDTGVPEVKLPDAISDHSYYLILEGAADGSNVSIAPLEAGRHVRLLLAGTCNPGDVLVLAAINGTDDGKVRTLPTAAGTYRGLAIAEESGVAGQHVKARPAAIGNITVSA